ETPPRRAVSPFLILSINFRPPSVAYHRGAVKKQEVRRPGCTRQGRLHLWRAALGRVLGLTDSVERLSWRRIQPEILDKPKRACHRRGGAEADPVGVLRFACERRFGTPSRAG